MKKLLFVEQFYYPDGWNGSEYPISITNYLSSNYNVRVLCGNLRYSSSDPFLHPSNLIDIIVVKLLRRYNRSLFVRFLNLALFALSLFVQLIIYKPRIVFSQTNPAFIVYFLSLFKLLFGYSLYILIMDLYPDVLIPSIRAVSQQYLTKLIYFPYILATKNFVLTPATYTYLSSKGVPASSLIHFPLWATGLKESSNHLYLKSHEKTFPPTTNAKVPLKLVYTGNVGTCHDFSSFLLLLDDWFHDNKSFSLDIYSNSQLSSFAAMRQYIFTSPLIPESSYDSILSTYHMAVVTLAQDHVSSILPSKFIGYLARGMPILYYGVQSYVSELIESFECGLCIYSRHSSEHRSFFTSSHLTNTLTRMSSNSIHLYNQKFSFEKSFSILSSFI